MSLFAAPTAIPHGAIAPARPQPRARLRKTKLRFVLNLLMALSIWLSTLSPLLVPAQPALAETADWSTSKVTPPPAAATRPPYRAGMEPAAGTQAAAPAALAQPRQAGTPLPEALGTELAPDWLPTAAETEQMGASALQTLGAELTPDWLAVPTAGEQAGIPAFQSLDAGLALLPLSELFALPDDAAGAAVYQAGTCVLEGLELAGATPLSVVQGDVTTPYTFTAVISNTGYVTPTGALSLTLKAPANFYFVGNSAAARSQLGGTLTVVQPLLNQAAGASVVLTVRGQPASQTLPVSDVITVTYRLAAVIGGVPNPVLTNTLGFDGQPAACTAAQVVNTSVCPLAVRTPMRLQIPPYIVGRGNFAGDFYTVTVRNTGAITATDVSFELDPSQGFFFKGNSAVGASSQSGALSWQQPASDTAPGSPFVLRVADPFPSNTLAPGATITAVLRLGTNADAKSGQPLSVTLRSGAVTPQICSSTRENIATGRGNLVIAKTPDVQQARLGEVVTWTVSLRNTGLASVYDAVLDDQMESGLRLLSITPATTTAEIRPDQTALYTVTAEVSSCTGLRNNALSSWSIGNIDGTASITDPISDDAFIAYLFDDAQVSASVEPLHDLEFCGQPQRTVVVTVTSENAPARDLTLEAQKNGSFDLTPVGSDWVKTGSVLVYKANNGVLRAGETVTFSLNISFTDTVCDQNSGSLVLRPTYRAACPADAPPETGAPAELSLQSETAPSLKVTKTADARYVQPGDTTYYLAAPGETVYYTVTVTGRNPISTAIGPIFITDTLPSIFEGAAILRSDSGSAQEASAARLIETIITPTDTPQYTATLLISATVPVSGVCASGVPQINRARAQGTSCPECLAGDSEFTLYTEDPAPTGAGGYFRLTSEKDQVCGDVPTQQSAVISITNGITWTDSSYHDSLNLNGGVGPLNVVSGSVQVLVDDVDRTREVTVTTVPTLVVELDNIGSFSQTALITITYLVTSGDNASPGDDIYYVQFVQGGFEDPLACGVTRYSPVPITIRRAAINNLRIEPPALNSCSTNTVTLTVDGDHLDTEVTDQLVVTFTTDISDVITPTVPSLQLGGSLQGQTPAVTSGTIGSKQVVSFTFEPALVITRPGTIAFPLYRPCGVKTPLGANISYADACRVTKTAAASGGLVTRQSNLLLRTSPITYTIDTDTLDWQFAVRNAGDMTATDVLVTNTLPFGMHYRDAVRSGVEQTYLDDIEVTTGIINGGTPDEREVVSFTVPLFPPNSTIQFAGSASVDTCKPSDSLWIRLTQPCGGVGETCGGSQMARLGIQEARGLLLTSNTQQATIPLCSAGDVRLIVKNSSVKTDLYDFVVQQFLTDTTYVSGTARVQLLRGDGTVSPFVPFTPTTVSPQEPVPPFRQMLEWNGAAMDKYPAEVRDLLAERGPSDQLIIEFGVRTYCSAANPTVQASVAAANACSNIFHSSEDSQAVEVEKPIFDLQKQVRNVSEDQDFGSTTFAGSDDVLEWRIDVGNTSAADVSALHVTDTLPTWFAVTDIYTTETDYTSPIVQWKLYTGTEAGSPVPAESSITFWITGTVGITACNESRINTVEASYGCSAADMCSTPTYTAEAEVNTDPVLSIDVPDTTLDQCAGGPLPVTFANSGARTGAVVVTYTLPSGYQYDGLAPGTTPMPDDAPDLGATGVITFGYAVIGQQQVTNTLLISVTRDMDAGACLVSAMATAKLGYADSCNGWQSSTVQDSGYLTVLRSDLATFAQTPVSRTVTAGELYTWTITAPNTGSGATNNLVITETLDRGMEFVTATVGSSASTSVTPTYVTIDGRTVITWAVGSLPAGQTWTAQVAARPLAEQTEYRVTAAAHTACSDDGCQQSVGATSYAAPLQFLDKQVSAEEVSIAEPFVYTITADFYGSVVYTDTALVDVLPKLDNQLVFSYTAITVANTNEAANTWSPDVTTPGVITFTTADGTINGSDSVTITISGLISNEVAAQQGDLAVNAIRLDFFHDGIGYRYNDSASTRIKEPILGIAKAVSPAADVRAGSTVTYTLVVTHAPASDATAYNVVVTDSVPPILTYNAGSLQVSAPAPGAVVSTTLGNSLAITVSEYPTPAAPIYITYTAAPNGDMQPSSRYTNTAFVRYTSQPGENPYDRDGSGVGPNDYWSSSSAAFTSTAVSIDKTLLSDLDYTIGDFITYTVWITVPTGTTRNLVVTDTVPAGLLYQAPTSTLAVSATQPITLAYAITPSSGSGAAASQAILRLLEPVYNTTGAPAVITWTMRLLVVDDSGRTVNYNGAAKTNAITTTNVNEVGQLQTLTDSAATARIYEPLLHIGKEYVTAQMCSARLLADNFNGGSIAGWTIVSGTWSVANGWLHAPSASAALLIHGPDTWTDVSYSAIFSTTDATGSVGLIFRGQNANNYYRFVWTNTGSYQVVKVASGSEQQVLTQAGSGFITNRWYHLEIRSIGRTHGVYIDGQRVLTYTDNTANPFLTGSVGFYAANQNGLAFDDALVTRVGDAGCLVDANDLVTYTLTISNQGRLTGHDLIITDVLPLQSLQYVTYSMASSDGGAVITAEPTPDSTETVVWQVNRLTPTLPFDPLAHSTLVLTVTARVLSGVSAGVRLPNQALLAYDGQTGSGPAGVERAYSGGSHSTGVRTPDAQLLKTTAPTTVTIGERLHYTLTLPGSGGIPATLYTATVTDALPSGFRLVEPPIAAWDPADALRPADVDTTRSTSKTVLVDFTHVPSGTEVTVAITGVVENILANQDGVSYTNTATLAWHDATGEAVTPLTSNPVTTTLAEPHLIIEKLAAPKGVRPGDTVFFRIRVYHAATSTVPAYNVVITDIIPPELRYISGSWSRDNEPIDVADSGAYTETAPILEAYFPVISTTLTAGNPLELTFQGVVDINAHLGSLITNVVTTTWQSLPTDPDEERRDGSGGINDYERGADASVSLDSFSLIKTGPLTAVAGSLITYVVNLHNSSAVTGHNALLRDLMPFQVRPITATFVAPLRTGACDPPTMSENRPRFSCSLGDLPPYSSAIITVTGIIDPHTPDGSLIDNYAYATLIDSNGNLKTLEDEAETWIDTEADLSIKKTGPITAMAGSLITYTVAVSNAGPSHAHGVDIKDALPPGVTFVSGSASQGACASAICQLGEVEPGVPVTVVITATVGPGVSGLITNTAYVFSSTTDKNPSNNSSASTAVVGANTTLHVAKTDFSDPVYAGNTYLYQIAVTNTGPATAFGVVVTDTLPAGAVYEGSSPGCTYTGGIDGGTVTCIAGDMLPSSWFGFLINVRVPQTITSGTVVTNHVSITTTTNILTATSTLTDSEPTTWLQAVGSPTDLAISKHAAGSPTLAGSGAPITYTLNVTNNGPAPATAVQVSDLFPPQFQLVSIQTSRPLTQAQCSSGGVCDLGDLAVGQSVVVTLVMQAPANVPAGVYTNTAFVGSPALDSNPANNTASVGVTVNTQAVLQARKAANPNPAIAGESLSYVIFITNTGPSNANNVTVSDTLPAGFSPALIVSSQGSCAALPCNIGVLPPRGSAWVQVYGTVLSTVTQAAQLANTAAITATEDPTGVTASVTPGLAPRTSLLVNKTQTAPAGAVTAGSLVTYTIAVSNSGPGLAHSVDVKDQLPSGLSLAAVSAEGGVCAGALCQFGSLPAGATRIMTVVAKVDPAQTAGILTNTAAAFSPDAPVVSKTVATAITTSANLRIAKTALNSPVDAGGVLFYQIAVSNDGPSDAQSVTVTDSLPAGLTYSGGDAACAANSSEVVCAIGTLPAGAARTLLIGGRTAVTLTDGLQLTNVVTATSPTAAQPVTATAAAVVQQRTGSPADLILHKSGPITATAGELLRYTLTVTNSGPAAAAAVNLLDVLPAGVDFVAASSSQGLCERGITCQLGEMGVGMTATVLITGLVDANTISGTLLVNTAQVGSSNPDPNPLDNSSSFTTTAHAWARLTISKDANAANVLVGAQVQYRIVVTNSGHSTAQDVVVSDPLPADLANPLVSSSQGGCSGFPCRLGSLAPGATATILVVGAAAANGPLYNSASVASSTALDPASVLSAAVLVTVSPYADLALIKDASPTAIAGGQVVYTLTAVNNGPSAAQFLTFTDALPAQTTFASADAACTHSSGVVTCHLDELAAGAQASFLITATAAPSIPPGSSIENRAAVAAWTLDPAPANNSDRADTSIIAQAQLLIAKRASSDAVAAGAFITYTIAVTNSGPSTATGVEVKDLLPSGLLLTGVSAEGGLCAGPVCRFDSLPIGASRTMTIIAQVDPALPAGSLINTAAAASPDAPTVSTTVTTTVDNRVLLHISKTASVETAMPGDPLSYNIVVANAGPSTARNVVMADLLPAELLNPLFSSNRGSCSAAVCMLGDLAPGDTVTILVVGSVSPAAAGSITNTAQLTTTSSLDPASVLDDTVVTLIHSLADVMVAKTATPAVYAGQRITYVLSVYNAGPSAATAVQVTDDLPLSTTLAELDASCTAAGSSPTSVHCPAQAVTLNAGAVLTFTLAVTADADIPFGSVLQNRAEVASDTPDPNPANNRAEAGTNIAAAADFALDKSGPGSVLAGDLVTYVITVTNNGPSNGLLQDIKDTLPPSLTLISAALARADGGLTACAGAICEAAGAVVVGEVLTMTVVAQADPLLEPGAVLTNTATVFAGETTPDPLESNNQDTHAAPVAALAQIAIDKYDLIDPVYPDSLLAYVLAVFNAGPSVARGLVITDQLPSGVTYLSSTGDCHEDPAGVLTCQVGALSPGAREAFQVLVRVHPDVPNGAQLHNVAALTSTTPLTGSILYADEDTQVVASGGPQADLAVSKTAAPPTVRSGDLVTFTLVVTNNGPSPVANAQVLDLLPDGLSLVSIQPSQGFCNAGVNCLLGALAYVTATAAGPEVRGTAAITLVAQAYNDLLIERVLTNTVYAQSELQDPVPDNNYAAAAVVLLPADPRADVQITKGAKQSVFSAGGTITYTLAVFNAGPSPAENVVVDDPLPTGVTYVSAQPTPSGGLPAAPQWQLGLVQPNERITISLVVRTDASAQAGLLIHNQATVTTTTQDRVPANNTAAADTQVFGTVDLEVRKTANPTAPLAGGMVTYTIVLTNHGPSAAQDVDIKESLPPSVSLVSLEPQRGVCVSQICQFGVMSAGEQIVVTATVQVDPSLPPGTVLTNTVTGFTDTPDSDPSNNQDKEPVVVGPLVNLRISKHSQTITATVGTEITYTMIVTNYGPADSPNVVVTDIAPAGFAYLRTTNPLGCSNSDRWYVVCPLGPLPAQQTARLDIVFFIESVSPVSVTNRVVVNDPDAFDPEGGGQGEIEQPTDPKGPSAVTLTRFDVTPQDGGLLVTWETVIEIDSWSFRLWRSTINSRSTAELITLEDIMARGSGSTYTFLDTDVEPETVYYYWLQEIALSGAQKEIEITQGGIDLAPGHKLYLPCIQAP